jgi:hypothetical protein
MSAAALAYPFPIPMRKRRGMGALSTTDNQIASAAASAAVLTGTMVGGPLGGAIAGTIAETGILLANLFSGCGQTCTEATEIVNQAEPLLQQNLEQYLSAPIHYASLQAGALNNFNLTWNALVSACGNPALASAGTNCIADRQNGACDYQTTPGGWSQDSSGNWSYTYPGANGSGSTCWNWFVGYYDPIANDPTVVQDPVPGASIASSLLSSIGIPTDATLFGLPLGDIAIGAAGLLLLWWLL